MIKFLKLSRKYGLVILLTLAACGNPSDNKPRSTRQHSKLAGAEGGAGTTGAGQNMGNNGVGSSLAEGKIYVQSRSYVHYRLSQEILSTFDIEKFSLVREIDESVLFEGENQKSLQGFTDVSFPSKNLIYGQNILLFYDKSTAATFGLEPIEVILKDFKYSEPMLSAFSENRQKKSKYQGWVSLYDQQSMTGDKLFLRVNFPNFIQ